jgi:hypothetical protein
MTSMFGSIVGFHNTNMFDVKKYFKKSATTFLDKKSDENLRIPHSFKDSIDSIKGNSPFNKAEVVLIGDRDHFDPKLKENIWKFIKTHANSNDVILAEGYQCLESVADFFGIEVLGWDNMHLVNILTGKLDDYKRIEKQIATESNPDRKVELGKKIVSLKNEIKFIAREERNNSLLHAIDHMINKERKGKLFVIAGNKHYTDPVIEKIQDKHYIYFGFAKTKATV